MRGCAYPVTDILSEAEQYGKAITTGLPMFGYSERTKTTRVFSDRFCSDQPGISYCGLSFGLGQQPLFWPS